MMLTDEEKHGIEKLFMELLHIELKKKIRAGIFISRQHDEGDGGIIFYVSLYNFGQESVYRKVLPMYEVEKLYTSALYREEVAEAMANEIYSQYREYILATYFIKKEEEE